MRIMSETKKSLQFIALVVLLPIATAVIIGGIVYFTDQTEEGKTTAKPCATGQYKTHTTTIKGGITTPSHTTAERCDKFIIINNDQTNRLIAFGVHNNHTAYDGIEERLLGTGKSLQVTLNRTGDFKFHDHFDEEVGGTFTVTN